MLLLEPLVYYAEILKFLPNSYLAEDENQVIIGIDCSYFSGESLDSLKNFFEISKKQASNFPKFAGLFGVMSYDIVYKFESLGEKKPALYNYPNLYYANAKGYIHYEKVSKTYSFFGVDDKIIDHLRALKPAQNLEKNRNFSYEISTNLSSEKAHFLEMVEKAKEYIRSGDIFQVVLAEILEVDTNLDSLEFYKKLKENNPSPYMFHFPSEFGTVVGSSPELVLRVKGAEILVAPIAGTRRRGKDANEDLKLKNELLSDEKELAEHKMLIDLARNDISKFSTPFSVSVRNPLSVVFFESVMHIISEVYGEMDRKFSAFDLVKKVFPAGTLSGTPKIRAMQIIGELEQNARGVYGGGLGFWHFNGDAQISILIRSAIFTNSKAYIGAGAGIVLDSIACNEYDEICNKRNSCLKVIKEICK